MATTPGELTNRKYQSKKYLIRNIIDPQTWVELSKLIAPILDSEFFMNFTKSYFVNFSAANDSAYNESMASTNEFNESKHNSINTIYGLTKSHFRSQQFKT